ncbi:fluoride efflux transporter CrcB [bacterium]|nr:fluoride efflux transporter CrcB [bacterium]
MNGFLLVAAGGAIGAMLRYGASLLLAGRQWPVATFLVNVTGALLLGALAGWTARAGEAGDSWRLLLGVGVLGGFTTFSTFSFEVIEMFERRAYAVAFSYVGASVVMGVCAAGLGYWFVRRVAA